MEKKITIVFIIICVVIVSIPLVLVNLRIKVDPVDKNERKISMNFRRNFPLKADLLKIYTDFKTNVFEVDPIPNRVVDTKNGWRFLGNDFSYALSESKGMVVFSPEELATLKKNLIEKKKWLNERHIVFYLAVAANKHTIYGDMIKIKKSKKKTKFQQLDSLCKTIGVNFINLQEDFPEKSDQQLYHKTDTHWNGYAAHYAYLTSMKAITKDFDQYTLNSYTMEDVEPYTTYEKAGDLNIMLMDKEMEGFTFLRFKNPEKSVLQPDALPVPSDYHNLPKFYEARYHNDTTNNDLKILVFHDSFFPYYQKYFRETFDDAVFIWNHKFHKNVIETEMPDIFYHEILERDLDVLLND